MKVTSAERAAIDAVLMHGTVKGAAVALGKSPNTIKQQLATARMRTDVTTTLELVRVVVLDDIAR